MKQIIGWFGFALLGLGACQQQEPAAAPLAAPPPAEPVALAPPPPAPAEPVKAPPPPAATAEERSKWFKDCWALFNVKDYAKFSGCYAENATSEQVDMGMPALSGRSNVIEKSAKAFATAFPDLVGEPQLTLVSGNDILSVVLLKGTHKGPFAGPQGELAASNKKIGYLMLHHVQTTPDGRSVAKERFLYDASTFMAQIGANPGAARKPLEQGWAEKPVLNSAGSDAEKANLAAFGAWTGALNKHDPAALAAVLTDDVVFSDLAAPADRVGKKEVQKANEELFKAFPDLKLEQSGAWAAGDYVISAGRFLGTNTGDAPSMRLKKTGKAVNVEYYAVSKLAAGKVKNSWMFSNGMAFAGQLGLLPAPKPSKDAKPPKDAKPAAAAPPAASAKDKDAKATPAPGKAATPASPAAVAAPSKDAKAPPAAPPALAPKAAAPAAAPAVAPKAAAPAAPPAAATPPKAPAMK